ncbi:MAG TPA: DNA polymerase III subunit delta [Vicinamibacteria bacterium]|nr:DNA polymerase III subunit delta [Vicinamibacteria bacterium]
MARPARPGPIQAIVGEDTYLAEEALDRVLAAAIGEDRQDGLQVFYGDEARWDVVLGAARTGSLFAPRRAVVVRRAELLKGDEEAVFAYAGDPAPDATLVLVAAKPDRRRNPWKKLLPKVTVHDASPKKGRALRAHVEQELRGRGLRFAPDALEDLLAEVGQDLRRLMGEVDKLEAFAAERTEIRADDVAAVLGRGLGQPLYLLSDAFAGREVVVSLELVARLLGDGEDGLRLLSTLHRSLRQVRGARAMREARAPRDEIGAKLLPPNMQFKLDSLLAAAGRWTDDDLGHALVALDVADRRMKRGADAATTLVAALAEACRSGSGATSRRGR